MQQVLNKGIMKSLAKWRTRHLAFAPATQLLRWETLLHGGGGATTATAEAEAEAAEVAAA